MAASSRGRSNTDLQQYHHHHHHPTRKWNVDRSPERTKIRTETNRNNDKPQQYKNTATDIDRERKSTGEVVTVPVVYYLSRNGLLEHPHFIQVPVSSPDDLFLRDVMNRLNLLRGKGMASIYSWSCKRSYKNGFVWHDLTENDMVHPAQAGEYVLKGSELLLVEPPPHIYNPSTADQAKRSLLETTPSFRETSTRTSGEARRRRNQSWSSVELTEYKVLAEYSGRLAAASDAATQTGVGGRRGSKSGSSREGEERMKRSSGEREREREIEIEISPPASDSSPETLESLMKADGRLVLNPNEERSIFKSRVKASTVLMSLLSCGSISFRDCAATNTTTTTTTTATTVPVKEQCHSKIMLPRGMLQDKQYFSGSLVETSTSTNNLLLPDFKRSNSYNEHRSLQLQHAEEEEVKGVRTKCIPMKSKASVPIKKDSAVNVIVYSEDITSHNSPIGSKRFEEDQVVEQKLRQD